MIVTTGFEVEGKPVGEYLGVVRGIVVRATGIGRGFVGGLKSIMGGNI
ncbi:MAG: heavy metal-binding domain-containing protein, partial [Candidatus Binatia bacterium]